MVVDRTGPVCGCGRKGCLEAFLGGRLFVERYNAKSSQKIADLDAHQVFLRAQKNDELAKELVASWVEHLAIGVGNLINIFNPSRVTLSGGLSAAFPKIKKDFDEILLREAFKPSLKYCEVVVSKLQERAGFLGAALWARQQHHRHNGRTEKMSSM
jgi:glucokinase